MLVNVDKLPYSRAKELFVWCIEHNIETDKCDQIIRYIADLPYIHPDKSQIEWELDIPDQYMTFFLLKWS